MIHGVVENKNINLELLYDNYVERKVVFKDDLRRKEKVVLIV